MFWQGSRYSISKSDGTETGRHYFASSVIITIDFGRKAGGGSDLAWSGLFRRRGWIGFVPGRFAAAGSIHEEDDLASQFGIEGSVNHITGVGQIGASAEMGQEDELILHIGE